MHILSDCVKILFLFHGIWILCTCQDMRVKGDKYILLWGPANKIPNSLFLQGHHAFEVYNCAVSNCFVTHNKNYFHGSMSLFDAIIFNGNHLPERLRLERFMHQKYVYANMEPAPNHPICNPKYDGFFNWTATYKLDSDFIFPHVIVKNASGKVIGPNSNIKWIEKMQDVDEKFVKVLKTKSKAVAWFVSNCTHLDRNQYVDRMQKALKSFNLAVDIYGRCGGIKCSKPKCLEMLKRDYYFYLVLEPVQTDDYVTGKIVPALQNYVVPIVYGGADYSRFLPPNSYLNGKEGSPEEVSQKINALIQSPDEYYKYFKWRRYYRYVASTPEGRRFKGDGVCKICEALNNNEKAQKITTVNNIRSWWDPNFQTNCGDNLKSEIKTEAQREGSISMEIGNKSIMRIDHKFEIDFRTG